MIEEKYIELLLKRCLKLDECEALFINFKDINEDFVKKVEVYANEMGIQDVYLLKEDSEYIHDILKDISIEEIESHEAFNSAIWDEYAKKNTAFLMFDSEIPYLMDDIDADLLAKAAYTKRNTKPIYRKKQMNSEIPWCIAALPNELWAKDIFPDSKNPLKEFWNVLSDICFLNKENPIKEWDKLLETQNDNIKKLNELKIKKLHYKNALGTDLTIELPEDALWASACSNKWIVNLPSYEIFTTPNYKKTNGIVYSSMPLLYNGKLIDNFSLTFEKGKVVDFKAEEGEDILKEIINGDELSAYLGEAALVNYDSPISNTKLVFKSTLFDENASCHLALGNGFTECIKDGNKLSNEELKEAGINLSKNHVDFMIGTEDLIIEAETNEGSITIMENGNLVI